MRIIVWGINYSPEITGIAPFNTGMCDYLREHDHQVEMVTTFPYYPYWQKIPGDRGRLYRTDDFDGVWVHRCWHYVPRQVTTLKRIWHEFSFGLTSFCRVMFLSRADVYIVISPPLILGPLAAFVGWLKRRPYVFHVQDLQPDAAVGLGMVKPGLLTRLLFGIEALSYRRAAAVSGISGGMLAAYTRKGVPESKRTHFPNWIRWYGRNSGVVQNEAERANRGSRFRQKFKIPADVFLASYSGNLGRKQGLDTLFSAAALLAGQRNEPRFATETTKLTEPPGVGAATSDKSKRATSDSVAVAGNAGRKREVLILVVGDGVMRTQFEAHIEGAGWQNIRLMPLLTEADYHGLLAASDIGLILQAPGTGQYFLPSKLLSILSMHLPVVTAADDDSELAKAIGAGKFGVNVAPGNPEALADALAHLAENPAQLQAMAERTNWVQRFAGDHVLGEFAAKLREVARAHNAGGA